ncbi:uncharacterized protein A4U43_C04F19370 [Asparagus officinalis]|uniref:COP9 signalosome complex subunit 3 n=1 Tax=Asparagus officinalis TaxID=4686 RepID=A0A5P1F2N2_ASPOF|nr:uncharacterized protein A4U43_C04F19370 [Asparagus officinalis]
MDSIEALVVHIQALSSNPQDISHLHPLLKQSDDSLKDAFSSRPIIREQASGFLVIVVNFINSCSEEQIRLAPEKFISICRRFKDQIMQLQAPMRGVAPLRTAIRKLRPSSEHLTALHADFLLLCILSKRYKAAQSILDERVITAPMSTLNAIAVEAYKKYILVSLIHNGQVPPFPKYISSAAQRNLKNYTQPYVDLASSYASGKVSELETSIEANLEKFQSDNNLGLVKQALSSLYKRNIQRLTQTYLTLSLQDIASTVQLNTAKDAEMHVLRMIQDGEIFATINQKDGMVSFHEDPEQYKSCEMIEHIDSSIQRLMTLSKKLHTIDEQISCDPAYLHKLGRERPRYDFDDFDSVPHKYM